MATHRRPFNNRLDSPYGHWPQGSAAHFLWLDSRRDIYINQRLQGQEDKDYYKTASCLIKYRRVG